MVVLSVFETICSSALLYLAAKSLLCFLSCAVMILFWKLWIVLFVLDSHVLLDVVIQVVLILISCTSEVYHMGDVDLHAGSVKANTRLGICVKNITEQKTSDSHLYNLWKVYFLNLSFQIIYLLKGLT